MKEILSQSCMVEARGHPLRGALQHVFPMEKSGLAYFE
jgi:hypothetical protein